MIPKSLRLPKLKILKTLKKGKKIEQNLFRVKFLPSRAANSRFSVIVSTKVATKAVARNRIRRQIFEIIRLNQGVTKGTFDIVLISKAKITEAKFENIKDTIIKILKALH